MLLFFRSVLNMSSFSIRFFVCYGLLVCLALLAKPFEQEKWSIDPVVGFKLSHANAPQLYTWIGPNNLINLQVYQLKNQKFSSAKKILNYFYSRLPTVKDKQGKTLGIEDNYYFANKVANKTWQYIYSKGKMIRAIQGKNITSSVILLIHWLNNKENVIVFASYPQASEAEIKNILISTLASFSLVGGDSRDNPHFVDGNHIYHYLTTPKQQLTKVYDNIKKNIILTNFYFNQDNYTIPFDLHRSKQIKEIIEIEKSLLYLYPSIEHLAMARFYRRLYRESEKSIFPFSLKVKKAAKKNKIKAHQLIEYLHQGLYNGRIVDMQNNTIIGNPIDTLITQQGDCDSKSLLMKIILDQLAYYSQLFISYHYQHAGLAVDMAYWLRAQGNYKNHLQVFMTDQYGTELAFLEMLNDVPISGEPSRLNQQHWFLIDPLYD